MGLFAKLGDTLNDQNYDQVDKVFRKFNLDYGSYLKTNYSWNVEFNYDKSSLGDLNVFKTIGTNYLTGSGNSVLADYLRYFTDQVVIRNFCNQKKPADNPKAWEIFNQITQIKIFNGPGKSAKLNGSELCLTENFLSQPVTFVNGRIHNQDQWTDIIKNCN